MRSTSFSMRTTKPSWSSARALSRRVSVDGGRSIPRSGPFRDQEWIDRSVLFVWILHSIRSKPCSRGWEGAPSVHWGWNRQPRTEH